MLTAFLKGGLGNQLFQISNVISRARKENEFYKFITHTYTPMQARGAENYVNNIYKNIDFSMSYDEYYSSKIIDGYFQDFKYFKEISEEIKDLFSPSQEFLKKIYNLYSGLFSKKTLSIHVRRGDYLNLSNFHTNLDIFSRFEYIRMRSFRLLSASNNIIKRCKKY